MPTIAAMLLSFDTSTAACTAALFDEAGACIDRRDEVIGRGHAERLVPMIAELLDGRTPDQILVGVGPGSFTGIRVAIAAAHGLAIGWDAEVKGMSSLALIAAGVEGRNDVGIAVSGGHGELFVQSFDGEMNPKGDFANLPPDEAAAVVRSNRVFGSGAAALVDARGYGAAEDRWPAASDALAIPVPLRSLPPKPLYGRAPDARVPQAA